MAGRSQENSSLAWNYFMKKGEEGQCNKCKRFYKAHTKKHGTGSIRNHLKCRHPELFAELLEEEAKRKEEEKKQETRRGSGGEDGIVQCSAQEEENGERRAGRGGRAKRVQEKRGERRGGKGVVERGGRNKQVPVHSSSAHEDAAPVPAPSRPVGSSGGEPGLEEGTGTRHLAQLFALRGYDPSLLDDECFRKFLSSVNPEYNLPTRDAISGMCDGIVAEAQESLKSMLRKSPPPGRVTLAVGRAQTIRGEVIYTACHFIDDDWKLHRVLLDAYVVAPAIGYHDPLMGVNEVTPHMLPERVVADCLELGITPGNLYRMAGEMTDGFQSQLIDSIKQLLMGNYEPNYGTTYYMGTPLETNATYMDSVLHSTARCLGLDRAFTDEVFGDVQIYSMNRRKREWLLPFLRLDSPLDYGEQWYSWYCTLTTMHRGGLNAVEGSKSFVGLVCKVWGAIYGAIRRISNPSCPASDLCPVLLQVSDALKAEIDNADVSHKFKGFQGGRNVVDILRDAKDTLDKAIQDEFLLWSIPLALDPRHKLTTPIFESVFGSKEAAENKIAEVKSKMHDLFTDYTSVAEVDIEVFPELDRYLEDDAAPETEVFDVMDWWREHGIRRHPTVAEMARDVLATPMCGRLPSEKMAHVSSIVRGYTQEKHIRPEEEEEEEAVDNDAEQQETPEVVDGDLDEEILDMKALIVKQRGMLDDTRRRMKKAYRSMEKRIISLEREVRSGRQRQAAFRSNTGTSSGVPADNDELKNSQEYAKTAGKDTSPEKGTRKRKKLTDQSDIQIRPPSEKMFKPIKDKNDAYNYYQTPISIQDFRCTEQVKATMEYIRSSGDEQILVRTTRIDNLFLEAKCLKEITQQNAWLENHIIDAYTAIVLQPLIQDSRFLCPVNYGWMASNYSSVSQRVIQDLANTIFAYDKVFMPFQVKQQHWIVVVIMNKEEEFQILDSLWKLQKYEPEIKKLIDGIAYIANTVPTAPQNVRSWNYIQKQNVPKQTDGCSCGLYIIKYMELWNGSRLLKKFTQADIDNFRKEMVADLIFAEANEALDVKEDVQALMSRKDADS